MLGLLYVIKDTKNKGKDVVKEIKAEEVSKRIDEYKGYVITNKDAKLYKLQKDKYKKVGSIKKDSLISLDENNQSNDDYYRLSDSDYYIDYRDIKENVDELSFDDSFHKYIVFNENIGYREND